MLRPERREVPDWFVHIENGDLGRLRELVDSKGLSDLNSSVVTPKWDGGITVLGRAILMGNVDMVTLLVKKGADVEKTCATHEEHKHFSPQNKFSPLGAAISVASPEIVFVLLNEGASVTKACFNDVWTPLEYAASKFASRLDVVTKHFSPADQEKRKAEQAKLEVDLMRIVGHLLDFRADVNTPSKAGDNNVLGLAVFKGHVELVQALLKKGASVSDVCFTNTAKTHQYTPLGLAAALKFSDVADVLKKAGASPEQEFKFAGKMTTPRAMGF